MNKLRDRRWILLHQKMTRDAEAESEKRQLEMQSKKELEKKSNSSALFEPTKNPCSTDYEDRHSSSSDTDDHANTILDSYSDAKYQLHNAVKKGDEEALPALISKWKDECLNLYARGDDNLRYQRLIGELCGGDGGGTGSGFRGGGGGSEPSDAHYTMRKNHQFLD